MLAFLCIFPPKVANSIMLAPSDAGHSGHRAGVSKGQIWVQWLSLPRMHYSNVVDGHPFKSYVREFARSALAPLLPLPRGGVDVLLALPRKRRMGDFERNQGSRYVSTPPYIGLGGGPSPPGV